jgi:cytochrome bd-I ubiquinol oxidase subunit X
LTNGAGACACRSKEMIMWYFAWLLGLPLAVAFAVLNAMWYELMDNEAQTRPMHAAKTGGSKTREDAA